MPDPLCGSGYSLSLPFLRFASLMHRKKQLLTSFEQYGPYIGSFLPFSAKTVRGKSRRQWPATYHRSPQTKRLEVGADNGRRNEIVFERVRTNVLRK
jgi:CRISPR/Cas system-associated endonuclease Cas1